MGLELHGAQGRNRATDTVIFNEITHDSIASVAWLDSPIELPPHAGGLGLLSAASDL